jgi:hypothetical protein
LFWDVAHLWWFPDQLILTTGSTHPFMDSVAGTLVLFYFYFADKKIIDLGRKSGKMLWWCLQQFAGVRKSDRAHGIIG